MKYDIAADELKKARVPHEVFLTNLIFNHILVFVAIISASSLTQYVVIVPIFSVVSLIYLFWGASRASKHASWYVNAHWQIAARRSRFFLIMLAVMGSIMAAVFMVSGGDMKPQHWALGGVAFLPVMITVLGLIVFESESLHQAKNGVLPDWVSERFPENALTPLEQ
jgi:hypothetical protein